MKNSLFVKFLGAGVMCLLLVSSAQGIVTIEKSSEVSIDNYLKEKSFNIKHQVKLDQYKTIFYNQHKIVTNEKLLFEKAHQNYLNNIGMYEITNQKSAQTFSEGNHAAIYIDGNDDFTIENGVSGGSGTNNDPYIIENWIIIGDGSAQNGILINNTDVYFVIRSCSLSKFDGKFYSGVRFDNVKNGKILDVDSFNNYNSIILRFCTDVDVENCKLHDNSGTYATGVDCYRCSHINIKSCEIYRTGDLHFAGVELFETNYCLVQDCTISDNWLFGIDEWSDDKNYPNEYNIIRNCRVYNSPWAISSYDHYQSLKISELGGHNTISGCEIYNSYSGIEIAINPYCIIENCDIHDNTEYGIEISDSSYNTVRNCYIHDNSVGVSIWGEFLFAEISKENLIEHCDIYNNGIGIEILTTFPQKIYYNNINNNKGGILTGAILFGSAKLNNNNIYDNFVNENGTITDVGLYNLKVFCDATNNWWGSDKGPSTYFFEDRGNTIINLLGFVRYRPWATAPIIDAGVND